MISSERIGRLRPLLFVMNDSAVDFCEIPIDSRNGKLADTFELFAREFFSAIGFRIIEAPARGPDLGRDLVVEELLVGKFVNEPKRWIVSAKHYAHSGNAVRESDEIDPKGRVDSAAAAGFIAFYSTLPTTGLRNRLTGLPTVQVEIFDSGRIAQYLLTRFELSSVFQQYFAKSWRRLHPMTERDLIASAETDPMRPDSHVVIELASLLSDARQKMRFADRRVEHAVVAAVLASEIGQGRLSLLERFISFEPAVWRCLVFFLQEQKPGAAIFASAITGTNDPFVLRNLVALAGSLQLKECAQAICERTMMCGRYDRAIAERGYSFGISGFSDVARRALSNLGESILPQLEHYQMNARERRQWKAKAIFERAITEIARRLRS